MSVPLRRIVAYRGVLAGCCVVIAVVTLGLTGLSSYLGDAAVAGVRSTLSTAPVPDTFVSYSTGLADDEPAQRTETEALLDKSFGGLPVAVQRSLTTGAIPLTVAPRSGNGNAAAEPVSRTFELRSFDLQDTVATVVGGRWPAAGGTGFPTTGGDTPVAIPRAAADSLGIRIGDTLTAANGASGAVRIVAVVQPLASSTAAAAAFEPLPADQTGAAQPAAVVLMTDEADLLRLVPSPSVRWTVTPEVSAFGPADVEPTRNAAAATRRLMNNDAGINQQGVSESGALAATLDAVARSLAAVRAAAATPLLLVGSFGLILLVELSALAARARRPELALLAARGVPPRTLIAQQLAESAMLAAPAALVGALASVLVRRLTGPGHDAPGLPPWWPAAGCALVSLASAGLLAWRATRGARRLPARAPGLPALAPGVLIIGAAAVSLWRFRQLGSAVISLPDGGATLDPVALPAPVLLLLALALGVGLLVAVAALLAGRLAARRRGLELVLPARQVGRRLPTFGGVALLVGLAVAGVTVAAGYGPTRARLADLAAVLTTGGDLRVQLPAAGASSPPDSDPAVPFRSVPGARQATSVLAAPIEIGSVEADLAAVPASSLAGLTPAAPPAYDPAAIAAKLATGGPTGLPLPRGAGMIELDLEVTSSAAPADKPSPTPSVPLSVGVVVWLATGDGPMLALTSADFSVPVAPGDAPPPLHRTVSVRIPPVASGGAPIIAAVDTVLQTAGYDTIDSVTIASIRADARPVPIPAHQAWIAPPLEGQDPDLPLSTSAAGTLAWGGRIPPAASAVTARLMPAMPEGAPAGIPVVLNGDLATRLGTTVGAPLDFRFAGTGRHLQVSVAGISPVLPGAARDLLAVTDLDAATEQLLRTTVTPPGVDEIRISGDARLASGVGRLAAPDAVIDVAGEHASPVLVGPATTALWAGSGLSVLLAVLAVATAMAGQAAERRGEAVPMLAAGLSRRSWIGSRRREFTGSVLVASCLGLAAGLAANQLTTGALARSAVVDTPDGLVATVTLSPAVWVVLLVAGLAVGGVLLAYGRILGRQWDRAG